jgi:hypothetical protein
LDTAYDEIVDIMEAHILLDTDSKAVLEGVISAFNPTIERYIKLLNARRGKGGKGGGEDGEGDDGEAV